MIVVRNAGLPDASKEAQYDRELHVQLTRVLREYGYAINRVAGAAGGINSATPKMLVNGSFQVWQRGTSFASAASRVVTADRWHLWRNTFALGATVSRQTGGEPSRYCARVQRDNGNASTAFVAFAQPFTSENSIAMRGLRLGVRFRARCGANYSSSGSTLTVQRVTGTGTDEHPSAYTGAASASSTDVVLTSSFQYFTADLGTVATAVTEQAIQFNYTPVGTAGANDYFELQEVQLVAISESNATVGEYQWRSFEDELIACLPYYEKSFPYATAPAQNAGGTGAFHFLQSVGAATASYATASATFSARKRATPTVTLYNPSAANAQARNYTGTSDWSSCSAIGVGNGSFILSGTTAAGSAAADLSLVHWTAEAEL